MNRCLSPRLKSLCLALVLPLALAACGNKGPLVLDRPAPDAKAETPVEPADAPAPAETPAAESPPPPGR